MDHVPPVLIVECAHPFGGRLTYRHVLHASETVRLAHVRSVETVKPPRGRETAIVQVLVELVLYEPIAIFGIRASL